MTPVYMIAEKASEVILADAKQVLLNGYLGHESEHNRFFGKGGCDDDQAKSSYFPCSGSAYRM